MSPLPTVECSFLVPISRDANLADGEPHLTTCWDWLDTELFAAFDGRTIAPGLYEGFYRDPDTRERVGDQSRRVIVAVAESELGTLRDLLAQACVVFQQKCLYLSVAGKVEFIEVSHGEDQTHPT